MNMLSTVWNKGKEIAGKAVGFVRDSASKVATLGVGLLTTAVVTMAQTSTPVEVVEGAGATAQTAWTTFAGISAAAFVFGMVIAYGRKGKK